MIRALTNTYIATGTQTSRQNLVLFGPSPPVRWAPIGKQHQVLTGSLCSCGNVSICQSANHCLAAITPKQVFTCLQNLLKPG